MSHSYDNIFQIHQMMAPGFSLEISPIKYDPFPLLRIVYIVISPLVLRRILLADLVSRIPLSRIQRSENFYIALVLILFNAPCVVPFLSDTRE
jgi:hypothetical protein